MTILNIHVEESRALIAINTHGVRPDGSATTFASKLYALPHANAVIVFRGVISMGLSVYLDCCSTFCDLDEMVRHFPGFCARRFAALDAEAKQAGMPSAPPSQLFIVGWSNRWNKILALCSDQGNQPRTSLLTGDSLSPWEPSWGCTPHERPASVEQMVEVSQHQARLAEQQYPGNAWHGDLHLAEIKRDSIHIDVVRAFSSSTPESKS